MSWRLAFGACIVVSAGSCAVLSAGVAAVSYAGTGISTRQWGGDNLRSFLINIAAAGAGGYAGKVLGGGKTAFSLRKGWFNSSFSRDWPKTEWICARMKPVRWGKTIPTFFFNASTGLAGCAATMQCSLLQ